MTTTILISFASFIAGFLLNEAVNWHKREKERKAMEKEIAAKNAFFVVKDLTGYTGEHWLCTFYRDGVLCYGYYKKELPAGTTAKDIMVRVREMRPRGLYRVHWELKSDLSKVG